MPPRGQLPNRESRKAGWRIRATREGPEDGRRAPAGQPAGLRVEALRKHRKRTLELRLALGAGALPKESPVFGDIEGNWPNPYSMSDRWRNAVKSRKLPKVTLHALRHSHASALIAAGLDVVPISRQLGHASPALTRSTYSH